MLEEDMVAEIDNIPGGVDGWWKSGSRDDFVAVARRMVASGIAPEDALDMLQTCYGAVRSCYGD